MKLSEKSACEIIEKGKDLAMKAFNDQDRDSIYVLSAGYGYLAGYIRRKSRDNSGYSIMQPYMDKFYSRIELLPDVEKRRAMDMFHWAQDLK